MFDGCCFTRRQGRVFWGGPCVGAWQPTLVEVAGRAAGGLQPYKLAKPLAREKTRLGDKHKKTDNTNGNEFRV